VMIGRKHKMAKYWKDIDSQVKLKDPGVEVLSQFLNIQCSIKVTSPQQSCFTMSQCHYTKLLIQRFEKDLGEKITRSVYTPFLQPAAEVHGQTMEDGVYKSEEKDPEQEFVPGRFALTCRQHVGGLMWLMRATRPDISYAVVQLAKSVHKWSSADDKSLYRIFEYLYGSSQLGLKSVIKHSDRDQLRIAAYCDSDYAGDQDTRRSTSGWAVYLEGNDGTRSLLDWGSKTQGFVARSSAEAELVSASRCVATKLIPYSELLQAIGMKGPSSVLYTDSKTAMLCIAAGTSKSLRYIHKTQAVQLAWMRSVFESPEFLIEYIPTAENPADPLTKALNRVKLLAGNERLGVQDVPEVI